MSMIETQSPVQLSACGQAWGLRRLADAEGFFAMVAIDQRPPIEQLTARAASTACRSH
jgi:tagatose-1,6-bisphosphate aldolase